jgi:hypothetical protein
MSLLASRFALGQRLFVQNSRIVGIGKTPVNETPMDDLTRAGARMDGASGYSAA